MKKHPDAFAKLGERLTKMEDDMMEERMQKKAAEFPHVPGTVQEKIDLLRKAYAAGSDLGKSLEDQWAEWNQERAESGHGILPQSDTELEIERLAKKYQEENPGLSYEQSFARVTESGEGFRLLKAASQEERIKKMRR